MSPPYFVRVAAVCALTFGLTAIPVAAGPRSPMKTPTWKQIDQLVSDQKFEQAQEGAKARLEAARGAGDEAESTKALVRVVQLEVGLHGYETAVRILREEPWPKGPLAQATLQLFYAAVLDTYANAYGWEINRREKVESKGPVDLKAWTMDQIRAEENRAYAAVWARRQELGHQPIAAIKEYVAPNDYPKGIRDTLRDAVSYLWVQMLGNTGAWRPEHSNEVFQLDLPKLIAGAPGESSKLKLDDPSVHPLLKIGAILDDLESWHAERGQREAALEARLERLRRLHTSFTEAPDRAQIRGHLAGRLAAVKDVPWFSMGDHTLAVFWQEVGNAVKAHQVALEGAQAFPDSVGGKMCLSLYKGIEAPDLNFESMTSDGAGKRSIRIGHRNLPVVYFKAFAVDLNRRIAAARDYNLLPEDQEFRQLLASGKPVAEWKVELPGTPDYQTHQTFITPPMRDPGLYVVLASGSRSWAFHDSRIIGVNFILTRLAVTSRQDRDGQVEVTVLDGETGNPVQGATVELWRFDYQRSHNKEASQPTDAHGITTFAASAQRQQTNHFLVARKGPDVALEASGIGFYRWRPERSRDPASLVFTDRSIYRPQQKVLWKVVAYQPVGDARYQVQENAQVTVSLVDPNSQVVETKTVTTNRFGSAAGDFTVPTGRLLGYWQVRASPSGSAGIRVEEYKRPTFEASFKDPDSPLRLNQPAKLVGQAKYYFGLPVTSGTVRWQVTRAPIYPWWWWFWFSGNAQSQVVATGVSPLSDDGTFKVGFTPAADEKQSHAKDVTYAYTVNADITDEGGETRSASRSYRLGFVSIEARVATDDGFFLDGAPLSLGISRTNLDGVARPGKGSWRVVRLKQPDRASPPADLALPRPPPGTPSPDAPPEVRTPGDRLRPRWAPDYNPDAVMADWADGDPVGQGEVQHGADGIGKVALSGLPAGAYRIRYQSADDFGASYETFKDFVVAGAQTPLALPAVFMAQKTGVKVGETARLLVASGLANQALVLDTYRSGVRIDRKYLVAGQDRSLIEIPVKEEDRGGFTVVLTTLRDYQPMRFETSIFVPWDDRELKIAFATFRDKIRPGAQETWRVTVKSAVGKDPAPGAAELLAYMFDQSLDFFGPHSPPSVMGLYPTRTGSDGLNSSLGQQWGQDLYDSHFPATPGSPSLSGDSVRFFEGYGIGGPGYRMRNLVMRGAAPMSSLAAPAPARAEAPAEKAKEEKPAGNKKLANEPPPPPGQPPADKSGGQGAPAPAVEMRSNFSETAFWQPQLLVGADGTASIEFKVPDSVTSWNVWVHAITADLRGGSLEQHTRSVKELMVRPYVPRFLREGDQAEVKVVVNNASEKPLSGQLNFDIIDPETEKSVLSEFGLSGGANRPFTVQPGKGTDLTFSITAPKRVGQVAFRVAATAGDLSDGELRPVPLLPSRMHLAQSRFVTLHDKDQRTMKLEDLARNDDPTRINEQLVVTLDAQLFYTVLQALPYLTRYPYECSEQTLNRFVSTGIVSSLYKDYPAIQRMAQKMSQRDTQLETWDATDPNRKMALEETPWLLDARGGRKATDDDAINMLDSRITTAERDSALARLRKIQTANGAFPWFPGGPPSPYMTLYVMHGFARAAEFNIAVPKDVTQRGWQYLAQHFREDYASRMKKENCCWEFLTFLNYTATAYPDASYTGNALTPEERTTILDFSFKHWKEHSPYLKALLALTLQRMGRHADALKVWESVMDSAKTTQDEGTFWAREDRSWLWYNDSIETHAFALRTVIELLPQDARRHGLVQWLLINKKLNHWKSTRATAEVIYSLVKYLQREGALGIREDAAVDIGPRHVDFVFQPDEYTGKKNQIVIPGPEIDPRTMSSVQVSKTSKGFAFASTTWQFSTDRLPSEDRGDFFNVSRSYFKREKTGRETTLRPLAEGEALAVGDELEVQVSIRTKHEAEYVHLRDPRAAGLEPENPVSRYKWDLGIVWYEETRDSGSNFFFEQLPVGQYTFKYRLRASMAGVFRIGPATLQSMYAPEFNAYSAGNVLKIRPSP